MKIIKARPPIFEDIARIFPGAHNINVVFAYDNAIYNPSGNEIPPELMAHETVHIERQNEIGVNEWWAMYLSDAAFRFQEELLAHIAEYNAYCEQRPSRQLKRKFLHQIATRLSSKLYGRMISYNGAKEAITNG